MVRVPIKASVKGATEEACGVKWVSWPAIWQHDMARAMHDAGPGQFKVSFLGSGGDDGLYDFWDHGQSQGWADEHPAFDGTANWSKLIGYRTHGDMARCQKRLTYPQKILILSWQSAHTRGCSLVSVC